MYNLVRKELTDFFTNRMPVGQFRGLVQGYEFTQGMVDDCRKLNKAWAITIQAGIARKQVLLGTVQQAEAAFESAKTTKHRSRSCCIPSVRLGRFWGRTTSSGKKRFAH